MKALQVIHPRKCSQVETFIPDIKEAGPDRILVQPIWVSMCASAIPFFTGSKRQRTYPLLVVCVTPNWNEYLTISRVMFLTSQSELEYLVTHRFPIRERQQYFNYEKHEDGILKAVIDMSDW